MKHICLNTYVIDYPDYNHPRRQPNQKKCERTTFIHTTLGWEPVNNSYVYYDEKPQEKQRATNDWARMDYYTDMHPHWQKAYEQAKDSAYRQHLRDQEQAMRDMYAKRPDLKQEIDDLLNFGMRNQ